MKNFLLITLFSLAFQNTSFAKAAEWNDIELYKTYLLSVNISFPGLVEFKSGDKFEVLDFISGDSYVMYYQAHLVNCINPELEAEMILVNPNVEDTSRNRSVGIQLEKGCNLGIFVEPMDFYSPSIFEFEHSLIFPK